jgi:UDP:flavonoid glycosyltransferase YjiC (YdhE family)
MVLLPIFWDQHDNAQRVHERGYGVRLDTYRYTDDEMVRALRDMSTTEVRARAEAAGRRIRAADGVRRAADLIEAVAG